MDMSIDSAACTHVGRREHNEDSHCVAPRIGLFAVADGLGGYEGGEVASNLVVRTLREHFDGGGGHGRKPTAMLRDAVERSNDAVREHRAGRLAEMGTTVTALVVRGARVTVGHLGDSRLYRLRDDVITQLTRDHTLGALYEEWGIDEGMPRSYWNVVTRAIGHSESVEPDLFSTDCRPGDVFLLCSDGLSDIVDERIVADVLAEDPAPEAALRLVELAYAAGGRDNITAVVVRVV